MSGTRSGARRAVLRSSPRGFTTIEMLISFILLGLVGLAVERTLTRVQRTTSAQTSVLRLGEQTRDAGMLLSQLLRDVDAGEADIVAMAPESLTVKVTRQLAYVCQATAGPYSSIVISAANSYGSRWFDPTRDSLVVWVDGDSTTTHDDRWLRASLSTVTLGSGTCADGSSPARLTLGAADTSLHGVYVGAPVRSSALERIWLGSDASGKWYLMTSQLVNGSWTTNDEYAGPLLPGNGLSFTFYDSSGTATVLPQKVSSVGIVVRGLSTSPATMGGGKLTSSSTPEDSIVTLVALRNNPHP